MSTTDNGLQKRRSFLSKFAAGAAIVSGAVFKSQPAAAQSTGQSSWRPARHTQDDWLDQIPGSHRFIIDTISPSGLGSALLFANNFFVANQAVILLGYWWTGLLTPEVWRLAALFAVPVPLSYREDPR